MATMQARYPGKCARTGRPIVPGDTIDYDRRTKRCTLIAARASEIDETGPDDDNESAGRIAPDTGRYISHTFRTSGGTFYRNKRGRCEDAPCCGCCTI
jgi:hypothetical protein